MFRFARSIFLFDKVFGGGRVGKKEECKLKKEDATHQIELIAKFDPEVIGEDEIGEIILARQDCCEREIIEYEFKEGNVVKIFIYIFSAEQWSVELIKFYVSGFLASMTFPDGVKKSDVAVKVEKVEPVSIR